jgi:hypothetical protein
MGWQTTLVALGLTHLFIALPLHGALLRCCPEDLGLSPDGEPFLSVSSSVPFSGLTLTQALRRPAFWTLTASLALVTLAETVIIVHQVASLISRGYDAELAATLAGMLGLASLPGRYVFNILSECISSQVLFGIGVVVQAIGVVVLLKAPNVGWLVVYVVLYGAAYGAISPLGASVMADHFGRRAYGCAGNSHHAVCGSGNARSRLALLKTYVHRANAVNDTPHFSFVVWETVMQLSRSLIGVHCSHCIPSITSHVANPLSLTRTHTSSYLGKNFLFLILPVPSLTLDENANQPLSIVPAWYKAAPMQ